MHGSNTPPAPNTQDVVLVSHLVAGAPVVRIRKDIRCPVCSRQLTPHDLYIDVHKLRIICAGCHAELICVGDHAD
jgi:hypothetical protein